MPPHVMSQKDDILKRLCEAVVNGDDAAAKAVAEEALEAAVDPVVAIRRGLSKGASILGEKFEKLEVFLPHLMLAADAMKAGVAALKPAIEAKRAKATFGKIVIGTAAGDIHDIGKNLVATFLSAAGFEVYDLGVDVSPKMFVEKGEEFGADIIAISSLMAASAAYLKDVIELLKARNIREKYKVLIGGTAVFEEFADEIGADGYGRHVDDCVKIAKRLIMKR